MLWYIDEITLVQMWLECVQLSDADLICETRNWQHLWNALFDALHQLSGTHYRKLFSVVTLLQFLSLGLRHFSSPRLSLLSLLTNTLPDPSASEVTTLRRYTNLFIVIVISDVSLQLHDSEGVTSRHRCRIFRRQTVLPSHRRWQL